jgi:hypothetical protein
MPGLIRLLYWLVFILFLSCSENNKEGSTKNTPDSSQKPGDSASLNTPDKEPPAIASLETDSYVMKIYRALPFLPKTDPLGMFKVVEGHRFIVLDLSIRNISDKPIDMGRILQSARVKDENGKKYDLSIAAIASYTTDNPNTKHQAEYDALWSKQFAPQSFHRTTAYGFEAPSEVNKFSLSMPETAKPGSPRKEIAFSL